MEVICINCNEIHDIKEAVCRKCKMLMSPFYKDILKALAASGMYQGAVYAIGL